MSFATPAVLFALLALPAIWWLLRLTPPRPRREAFPPARILADLASADETPAGTPWWLVLLRVALAALVILALAGPTIAPRGGTSEGDGPLLVVIDNGWAAGADWTGQRDAALALLASAETSERPVALVATASGPEQIMSPGRAEAIANRIDVLEPQPFAPDYAALLPQIGRLIEETPFAEIAWISDGLGYPGADELAAVLASFGAALTIYRPDMASVAALAPPANAANVMTIPVLRSRAAEGDLALLARDGRGRILAETFANFAPGETTAIAELDLPQELRNDIARIEISGLTSAGAVQLLDESARRRTIGILAGETGEQPLLSAEYYLTRAIEPFADPLPTTADIAQSINDLVTSGASVIVLADVGTLPEQAAASLAAWVEGGGTLIRFAGPRLAAAGETALVPVELRTGGRAIGGALSWEEPQPLGPFPETSPFFGLEVPDDVTVSEQVLAEPTPELFDRTWAVLADGTPLVTAAPRGEGRIVLFHVTANTAWSNLPLSGAFVEMLRRIALLANAPAAGAEAEGASLPPYRILDGFGRMTEPGDAVEPLPLAGAIAPSADHPPGLYGDEDAFRAFNLIAPDTVLTPIEALETGATFAPYPGERRIELAPWLFAATLLLFLLDTVAVVFLGRGLRRAGTQMALLAALLLLPPLGNRAEAQDLSTADQFALAAANQTTLAYVITGDAENDEISRAGLYGLGWVLRQRTAFEPPAEPIGVDLARDELAFFPILYWRVSADAPLPDAEAMARLDAYMRSGGIVLFDTADQRQRATPGLEDASTPAALRLQEMLAGLDIPPLEPVPDDHVLTQTYYLLSAFPGRFAGGDLWVEVLPEPMEGEARPARPTDQITPVIITSNDFAAAWAADGNGAFLYPIASTDSRQREMAFRAGINLVIYALTGNYKTDQVHVPDLLQRLDQ